jgi:hypothetical protein
MKQWWLGLLMIGLLVPVGATPDPVAMERATVQTLIATYSTAATAAGNGDLMQTSEAFKNAQELRNFRRERLIALGGNIAEREMLKADATAEAVVPNLEKLSPQTGVLLDTLQRQMETIYAALPAPAAGNTDEALKQIRQQFDVALIELNEREFPQSLEFVERGASTLEANRKLFSSTQQTSLTNLLPTIEAARTALKSRQYRPARRALDDILDQLSKL